MAWVSPYRWCPARSPSPLPHLPSDWRELLLAYLKIVGVRSEDCYGVAGHAHVGRWSPTSRPASFRPNVRSPPKLPSADGEDRPRLQTAEHRDRLPRQRRLPGGRERWRAYQDEVLRARLDHRTGVRPPIEVDDRPPQSFLSEVFDMFNPLDPMAGIPAALQPK